jgi:hypothetical protein
MLTWSKLICSYKLTVLRQDYLPRAMTVQQRHITCGSPFQDAILSPDRHLPNTSPTRIHNPAFTLIGNIQDLMTFRGPALCR